MATVSVNDLEDPVRDSTGKAGKSAMKMKPPPLSVSEAGPSQSSSGGGQPRTPNMATPTRRHDRDRKIGHRRVGEDGQVTYKKKPTSELMACIQLGISLSIGGLASKPERDLLLQDFSLVESVFFPREGSNLTPAHHYSDFRFKTYAPIAFRYFRELFGIQPDDFLLSLSNDPLTELSNPGASGSIFYITDDDEFIIKTVQHKEADFLQKLLPGYYMNLNQNPRTLLPKFYGLYCYQCGGKNIRFTVMNNLLPSGIKMHEKYDLKGSTYKRKASKHERNKSSPTWKDLDFNETHPDGIMLEADTYNALIKTIERDCRVLQSFKIMDYSLLLGIHNLDQAARERELEQVGGAQGGLDSSQLGQSMLQTSFSRGRSVRQRLAQYSTAMEAIQARTEPLELDNEDIPPGGIPARNSRGERLLLYIGLIDTLQSYRLQKRLEHAMKSMVSDGDTISVHRPGFYANRFQTFFANIVFRKIPSPLKHSPSKKKGTGRQRSVTTSEVEGKSQDRDRMEVKLRTNSDCAESGAVGGRPDLLPDSTPPPTFSEATGRLSDDGHVMFNSTVLMHSAHTERTVVQHDYSINRPEVVTTSPSLHSTTTDVTIGNGGEGGHVTTVAASGPLNSPVHSFSESTPTHTEYTEGTPSFTTSSPSCSSDMLDSSSLPSTKGASRNIYPGSAGSGSIEAGNDQFDFDFPMDSTNTGPVADTTITSISTSTASTLEGSYGAHPPESPGGKMNSRGDGVNVNYSHNGSADVSDISHLDDDSHGELETSHHHHHHHHHQQSKPL